MTTYRIYGHKDRRPKLGFQKAEEFTAYIAKKIFSENQGRYRYSQKYFADVIVLSRGGKAYGHFEIESAEDPTDFDLYAYDKTKQVFIVRKATVYRKRVVLKELGLSPKQRGRPIHQADFDKIIAAAGGTKTRTAEEVYDPRYCRLCFNSQGWTKPRGEAEETKGYYADNHFGHEEWLFRYAWLIHGQKYGFFQPFTEGFREHQGKTFALTLYTRHRKVTSIVGTISKVYVPHDDELADAYKVFMVNGWLEAMKQEVEDVGGKVAELARNVPQLVINARFDPKDVLLFKKPIVSNDPWLLNRWRYQPWDNGPTELPEDTPPDDDRLSIKKREDIQQRAAAEQGTTVDPVHARLQNWLYDWLCDQHGAKAVGYEKKYVDLRLDLPGGSIFYEVKTNPTVKKCIRAAIGQLFEYATYPTASKAKKWIVVGDKEAAPQDLAYLDNLRTKFGVPIYYAQWDWPSGQLTYESAAAAPGGNVTP